MSRRTDDWWVIDTNVAVALLNGEPAALSHWTDTRLVVPVVVIGELLAGARLSRRRGQNEQRIDALLAQSVVEPVYLGTATQYALIDSQLRRSGRPIPSNDIWIAACARLLQLPLASRDAHFDQVPGLSRDPWW